MERDERVWEKRKEMKKGWGRGEDEKKGKGMKSW